MPVASAASLPRPEPFLAWRVSLPENQVEILFNLEQIAKACPLWFRFTH